MRSIYAILARKCLTIRRHSVVAGVAWSAFFLMIFSNIFKSGLLATLIKTHPKSRFDNLDGLIDLVNSGDTTVAVARGVNFYEVSHEVNSLRIFYLATVN